MIGEILSVVLRIALVLPKLIGNVETAVNRIEADVTVGGKVLDALKAFEAALALLLP